MESVGTVREFHADDGWGVIDGIDVPGGCFVSFAAVQMEGYRSLHAGQEVTFIAKEADQDGYAYRALKVWPGSETDAVAPSESSSEGYESTLKISTEPTLESDS